MGFKYQFFYLKEFFVSIRFQLRFYEYRFIFYDFTIFNFFPIFRLSTIFLIFSDTGIVFSEKFYIENVFLGIFLTEFGAGTAKYQNLGDNIFFIFQIFNSNTQPEDDCTFGVNYLHCKKSNVKLQARRTVFTNFELVDYQSIVNFLSSRWYGLRPSSILVITLRLVMFTSALQKYLKVAQYVNNKKAIFGIIYILFLFYLRHKNKNLASLTVTNIVTKS